MKLILGFEIGASLLIDLNYRVKGELRSVKNIPANFVGIEFGNYISVKLSKDRIEKFHYVFQALDSVVVKYILKGRAYAFTTEIIGQTEKPAPIIFLAYPENFESHSLRKEERVRSNPPAILKVAGLVVRGQVMDISLVGCRVDLLDEVENAQDVLQKGVKLDLSFSLPGFAEEVVTKAKIQWSRPIEPDWCLGLVYDEIKSEMKNRINTFIDAVRMK